MNVVTQLTQFVINVINTTDLAVRCSTGSIEFSWVHLSSVELSCVAINTPLARTEVIDWLVSFVASRSDDNSVFSFSAHIKLEL